MNVGFAEIAIEHLAQGDEDDEFYGLSEAGCVNGGYAMVELVEKHYVSREEHDRRVTELLEANNRILQMAREFRRFTKDVWSSGHVTWKPRATAILEKWIGQ